MNYFTTHLTQAMVNLGNLSHNLSLIQQQVGKSLLYPAIKANAYGHGAEIVARHLIRLGYSTLCTAHISEAAELVEKGIEATYIILSPTLPENSEFLVHYGFEPFVCDLKQLDSLAKAGQAVQRQVNIHIKVDTGMGRVGIRPDELLSFLDACKRHPEIYIKSICSHFPRADENDLSFSRKQMGSISSLIEMTQNYNIPLYHFANSAALFILPDAHFDAVRPGISMYGLKPSPKMLAPILEKLKPVLSWKSRITFLKEVSKGVCISYGHGYCTERPSLIATIPLGYGDGMHRRLSNKLEVLIGGIRCRQVGRICMDQCMIDVTALRGKVGLGDEVVIIGTQGGETITADELAEKSETINYEIVTAIARRVPRIVVE